MTQLSSEHTRANARNQEWLVLAKQADHNPVSLEKMKELLTQIDPYNNKCMLPRCCAQFGYIEALKILFSVAPQTDWEKVMSAAIMGNQKKSVEVLLAYIDPHQSVKESATIFVPNQALRLCIEHNKTDILHLLIAVVPQQNRLAVLLWTLEEYNHAVRTSKSTEAFENAVHILCPTTNATCLLTKDSDLPLNTPARGLLAEILAKNVEIIGDMSVNMSLQKIQ